MLTRASAAVIKTEEIVGTRNRIINGAMEIDQRNAGASVTPIAGQYLLDRWVASLSQASKYSVQQNAGAVTPPVGFTNYFGVTSLSSYSIVASDFFSFVQRIEGFNIADLGWGTANAKAVTVSFWVRSSLTGNFGASIQNNGFTRSYPFSYTISSANTWEYKTVTIPGDTSGTWITDTGIGLQLRFNLGTGSDRTGTTNAWAGSNFNSPTDTVSIVGTNGATFYITGVQLEVGSTATPFERRQFGTELALCQRYYFKTSGPTAGTRITQAGYAISTTVARVSNVFPVVMRTSPTALEQSGTAGQYSITGFGNVRLTCSAVPTFSDAQTDHATTAFTVSSGLTQWTGGQGAAENTTTPSATTAFLAWSAEL